MLALEYILASLLILMFAYGLGRMFGLGFGKSLGDILKKGVKSKNPTKAVD